MNDRLTAAIATAVVHGLLGFMLFTGLSMPMIRPLQVNEMQIVELAPKPPPPPRRQSALPVPVRKPQGAAAPPNLVSRATPVVAPPPIIPPIVPPTIVTAPVAGEGNQASTGAAAIPGPGPGAGGIGNGRGSGHFGSGTGSGETPPVRTGGRLRNADFPRAAAEAHAQGTVSVRYAVEPNGRVDDCQVTRSSGNDDLDQTTCRLIEQRFRFKPARDERGIAVRSIIVEDHSWIIEEELSR